MNDFGSEAVPMKPAGTSKFAVAAALSCTLCPFVGGPLGLVLGILGLIQIRVSGNALGGTFLAWVGILGGLGEIGGAAALVNYRESLVVGTPQAVQGFVAGVAKGDLEAAHDFMTDGLRPTLDRQRVTEVSKALREALGEFVEIGERRSAETPVSWPITVVVEQELRFSKGAPAMGTFHLSSEYGQMKVRQFSISSPVLRPAISVKGKVSKEVGEYDGPQEKAGPKIKKFK